MGGETLLVTLTVSQLEQLVESAVSRVLSRAPSAPAPSPTQSPALLARSGLALSLGISLTGVDRLVKDGCPSVFVGQVRRFDLLKVQQWIAARPKPEPRKVEAPAQPVSLAGVRRLSRRPR